MGSIEERSFSGGGEMGAWKGLRAERKERLMKFGVRKSHKTLILSVLVTWECTWGGNCAQRRGSGKVTMPEAFQKAPVHSWQQSIQLCHGALKCYIFSWWFSNSLVTGEESAVSSPKSNFFPLNCVSKYIGIWELESYNALATVTITKCDTSSSLQIIICFELKACKILYLHRLSTFLRVIYSYNFLAIT